MIIEGGEGIREAADPVVVQFKERYYLFASKSSGYWHSSDFSHWQYVYIDDSVLPIEDYAPGPFVHNDALYYVGSTHGKGMLYRSTEPERGLWEPVKEIWSYWDPAFYVEGDSLVCLEVFWPGLVVRALFAGVAYFFTVDAYNENGVTPSDQIIH